MMVKGQKEERDWGRAGGIGHLIYGNTLAAQGRTQNGLCGNKCTCSVVKREYSAAMQPIIFMARSLNAPRPFSSEKKPLVMRPAAQTATHFFSHPLQLRKRKMGPDCSDETL